MAALADVHGNAVALAAVLADLAREAVDLIVFGGDLTWGPLPAETTALVEPLAERAVFIRGNADRTVLELAKRRRDADTVELRPRELWMLEHHDAAALRLLERSVEQAVVDVAGLGAVRFCHGSPRSDEELVTPATPAARMRELLAGVEEPVLVTAHTHLQFDRDVCGIRSVNPGSVGMAYEGEPGAFWALLGPTVELRRTEYEVDEVVSRYRASGDPLAEQMVEVLLSPPTRTEVIEHAESHVFSG